MRRRMRMATRCSLVYWHGAWPLDAYSEFTAALRERAAAGAEVVLHGLRHDEVGLPRALAHRVRTFGRTDCYFLTYFFMSRGPTSAP